MRDMGQFKSEISKKYQRKYCKAFCPEIFLQAFTGYKLYYVCFCVIPIGILYTEGTNEKNTK